MVNQDLFVVSHFCRHSGRRAAAIRNPVTLPPK